MKRFRYKCKVTMRKNCIDTNKELIFNTVNLARELPSDTIELLNGIWCCQRLK
jgi:hypothetical protein